MSLSFFLLNISLLLLCASVFLCLYASSSMFLIMVHKGSVVSSQTPSFQIPPRASSKFKVFTCSYTIFILIFLSAPTVPAKAIYFSLELLSSSPKYPAWPTIIRWTLSITACWWSFIIISIISISSYANPIIKIHQWHPSVYQISKSLTYHSRVHFPLLIITFLALMCQKNWAVHIFN